MWAQGHQQLRYIILLLGVHSCTSQPAGFNSGCGSMSSVAPQRRGVAYCPPPIMGRVLMDQGAGPGLRGMFSHLLEVPSDTEHHLPQWELAWKHTFHRLSHLHTLLPLSPGPTANNYLYLCPCLTVCFQGNLHIATWDYLPRTL